MAVQASLVWPKIDEILEFADFSDRFFSYHPVVPWNDQEPFPAIQGTLPRHSGSDESLPRGPYAPIGKLDFAIFKLFPDRLYSYRPVLPQILMLVASFLSAFGDCADPILLSISLLQEESMSCV